MCAIVSVFISLSYTTQIDRLLVILPVTHMGNYGDRGGMAGFNEVSVSLYAIQFAYMFV